MEAEVVDRSRKLILESQTLMRALRTEQQLWAQAVSESRETLMRCQASKRINVFNARGIDL